MKTLLIYIGLFLTVLETSTASENIRKEGKARFIFRLRIFALFFTDQWRNLAAKTKGARKKRYFWDINFIFPFQFNYRMTAPKIIGLGQFIWRKIQIYRTMFC